MLAISVNSFAASSKRILISEEDISKDLEPKLTANYWLQFVCEHIFRNNKILVMPVWQLGMLYFKELICVLKLAPWYSL
jgi:hypothetical protein